MPCYIEQVPAHLVFLLIAAVCVLVAVGTASGGVARHRVALFARRQRLIITATNGQRVIGHSGGTLIFESDLILLPDQDFGLYISYNTSGAETSIDQLILALMNHYYPPEEEAPEPPAFSDPRAVALTGSYRLTRSSYTTLPR